MKVGIKEYILTLIMVVAFVTAINDSYSWFVQLIALTVFFISLDNRYENRW